VQTADIIVIGAGIAGTSAAAELAADARVVLLEMEDQPGYHATGRSAAYFAAAYGNRTVRALTACCEAFFRTPPDGFSEADLIHPRDGMLFGRPDQIDRLEALHREMPDLEFLDAEKVRERVPIFKEGYLHGALWEERGGDLDVDAILQGYLRRFRERGGALFGSHRVTVLRRRSGVWQAQAGCARRDGYPRLAEHDRCGRGLLLQAGRGPPVDIAGRRDAQRPLRRAARGH
jgi:D-arginine dehydrogenase